jgi:hypothetical protein
MSIKSFEEFSHKKLYSVILTEETEVKANYLFTKKEQAIAKVKSIEKEISSKGASIDKIEPVKDEFDKRFLIKRHGEQYSNVFGFLYIFEESVMGSVVVMECEVN